MHVEYGNKALLLLLLLLTINTLRVRIIVFVFCVCRIVCGVCYTCMLICISFIFQFNYLWVFLISTFYAFIGQCLDPYTWSAWYSWCKNMALNIGECHSEITWLVTQSQVRDHVKCQSCLNFGCKRTTDDGKQPKYLTESVTTLRARIKRPAWRGLNKITPIL